MTFVVTSSPTVRTKYPSCLGLPSVHLSLHFRKLLKHNFCRYRLQLANDLRNRQPWGKRDKQMNVVLRYFQSVKFYVIPLPNLKK